MESLDEDTMKQDRTLIYYNKNAADFINTTQGVDFHQIQDIFLSYLSEGASILDFGCGSGRDAKRFKDLGYQITAVDGSEELCKVAAKYIGIPVRKMLFQELDDQEKYDGIWACASILHLSKNELADVLQKMCRALKNNGIIYTSFKYGTFEGERNGRYFTDLTEDSFRILLRSVRGLSVEKLWLTGDVRKDRGNEKWLNIILRKRDIR